MTQLPVHALCGAVLLLCFATSAGAGFDEGMAAYERGEYATSLEEWQPLADGDDADADAQFNLGRMYAKGEGVPHDYVAAARWYGLAAEQGHGAAQFNLADLYKYGKGVPQGYVDAYMWWSVAATGGFAGRRQVAVDGQNPGPLAGEQQSRGAAVAGGRAGALAGPDNDCGFAVEPHHCHGSALGNGNSSR